MSNENENEDLEMVAVSGPAEGQMIEEVLHKNGIDCSLQGNVSNPLPATSDLDEVRIFVRKSDARRAEELLAAYFTPVGKDELLDAEKELGVADPDKPAGFTI
jgi:hypothetical protein